MSQHDMNLANADGATVRADINAALQALATRQSGLGAPATTYPYQPRANTGNGLLEARNPANNAWYAVGPLDPRVLTTAGAANTYTLTWDPALGNYAAIQGIPFRCFINVANTGAATLNVNSLGALDLVRVDGEGVVAGQLVAGRLYELLYDGTNLVVLNPSNPMLLFTNTLGSSQANVDIADVSSNAQPNGFRLELQIPGDGNNDDYQLFANEDYTVGNYNGTQLRSSGAGVIGGALDNTTEIVEDTGTAGDIQAIVTIRLVLGRFVARSWFVNSGTSQTPGIEQGYYAIMSESSALSDITDLRLTRAGANNVPSGTVIRLFSE